MSHDTSPDNETPDTTATFKNPQCLQTQSHIGRTPAEVRLMILRKLLRFPVSDEDDETAKGMRQLVQAGVQLMRTCQILYIEGASVLFDENTVCLRARSVDDTYILSAPNLGTMRWHTYDLMGFDAIDPDLLIENMSLNLGRDRTLGPDESRDILNFMTKFQSYRVVIKRNSPWDCSLAWSTSLTARCMRSLTLDKQLTIGYQINDLQEEVLDFDEVLNRCKILSCATLKVEGLRNASQDGERLKQESLAHDIYKEWFIFQECVLTPVPTLVENCDFKNFTDEHRDDLISLRDAAMRYDEADFKEKLDIVIGLVTAWRSDWWKQSHDFSWEGLIDMSDGLEDYKARASRNFLKSCALSLPNQNIDKPHDRYRNACKDYLN